MNIIVVLFYGSHACDRYSPAAAATNQADGRTRHRIGSDLGTAYRRLARDNRSRIRCGRCCRSRGRRRRIRLTQVVLDGDVHEDGEDEKRDDDVDARRDAEQSAAGERQRRSEALQQPEVLEGGFVKVDDGGRRRCRQ